MPNNSDESESETNPRDDQIDSFIYSLVRDKEYINSLYLIKKSILIDKNI